MNIRELREERYGLTQRMRAILDAPAGANGDLTAEQRSDFDRIEADVDKLDEQIRNFEGDRDRNLRAITATARAEALETPLKPEAIDAPWSTGGFKTSLKQNDQAGPIRSANRPEFRFDDGGQFFRHLPADLAGREDQIHIGRLVRGMATGSWSGAELERRAFLDANSGSGGYISQSGIFAGIIEAARDRMIAGQLGNVVPMNAPTLSYGTVLEEVATPEWIPEDGAASLDDSATFGMVKLERKKTVALVRMSKEFLMNSANGADLVRNMLVHAVAKALDNALLLGTGGGVQPTGILNWNGVTVTDRAGVALSLDEISEKYWAIQSENAPEQGISFVANADVMKGLDNLKDGEGQYMLTAGNIPRAVQNLRFVQTNQLATVANKTTVFLGDFSQVVVGIGPELELEIFRAGEVGTYNSLTQSGLVLRATFWGDLGVLRPEWFQVWENVGA